MPRKIIRRTTPLAEEPAPPVSKPDPAPKQKSGGSPFGLIAMLVLVACAGLAGWKYLPSSNKGATKASASTTDQVADLVKAVSKHIVVKAGETPMVAIVQDPDALRAQNALFYRDAQTGDRLLVWSDKAVLYSPSRDIVLAMAPLSPSAGTPSAPNTPVASPSKDQVTVEVRNGSGILGLATKAADKLKAEGWKVVTVTNAKQKDAKSSQVLGSSEKTLGSLPSDLAKLIDGSVVSSLKDETPSTADILVIVGGDYQP